MSRHASSVSVPAAPSGMVTLMRSKRSRAGLRPHALMKFGPASAGPCDPLKSAR